MIYRVHGPSDTTMKQTKISDPRLFFVSFMHFVVEKMIWQSELVPFFN